MVSPTRRREAVDQLERSFDVSQRRVCRAVGQPRATQRYKAKVHDDEPALVRQIRAGQPPGEKLSESAETGLELPCETRLSVPAG